MLSDGDTSVLVEVSNRGGKIELRARGPERKEMLSAVASELDGLNATYGDLVEAARVRKEIPCTCARCSETTMPHRFEQRNLVRRRDAGKWTVECDISFCEMDVLSLLDGVNIGHERAGGPSHGEGGYGSDDFGSSEFAPTTHNVFQGPVGAVSTGAGGQAKAGDDVNSPAGPAVEPSGGLSATLQVWGGAGLVIAAAIFLIFAIWRRWDFSIRDTWLAVIGLAATGAVVGTALGFLLHAFKSR